MEFKKIALIGAGAVGAYFIYGFAEREDLSFCVVAEGERAERLKKDGVIINEKTYRPVIKTAEEAKGADLLLVCTKYQGLRGTLDMIETIVDDHTTVISLLNGIDSEEIIAGRIGAEHLVYSVMRISSERRDGKIRFVPETTIGVSVGEKGIYEQTERVTAFLDLMKSANLKCFFEKDILLNQWGKYSMNIIYNLPQAILGVGFGAYYDSEHVAKIRDTMFEEVCKVAQAEGINLTTQGDWRSACVKKARFSTLQDLDAGRHTEVEMFAGTLVKLAKKHGLEAPFCEFAYHAIKALEEKGDGKFAY
ncbi:MAG: 2-dehydropantoate 2-reductase [Clostridiales bacterium]|nr:2-dehydropantoate 2-reductase [Candidatus Blautia equi]